MMWGSDTASNCADHVIMHVRILDPQQVSNHTIWTLCPVPVKLLSNACFCNSRHLGNGKSEVCLFAGMSRFRVYRCFRLYNDHNISERGLSKIDGRL
jgi:hypothetical protein